MVRTTAWWGTRLRGPARPGSPCNRRSEHVKDARADSRPPVATTPTMAALPIPGAHDEEHVADRDSFEPKFRGLTGFEIPARGRPETDAARPDPTPGTRPTPGLRDGHISAEVHVHDRRYGIPVQQPTLSTHRPGPGGTCAEGSGLEDFSASPSICCASVCIN